MSPTRQWVERLHPFPAEVPVSCAPIENDPDAPAVVLLHGMGETAAATRRFWPRVLALPVHATTPDAPWAFERRDQDGYRIGRAWYLYDGDGPEFRRTLDLSVAWLVDAIGRTERSLGMRPRARALVAHSQGAYLGYVAALRHPELFTHLVAVAGRLKESFVAERLARPGPLRTLILHGRDDRAVAPEAAEQSRRALAEAGYAVEVRSLPGGHGLRPDRDREAARWLASAWDLPLPE